MIWPYGHGVLPRKGMSFLCTTELLSRAKNWRLLYGYMGISSNQSGYIWRFQPVFTWDDEHLKRRIGWINYIPVYIYIVYIYIYIKDDIYIYKIIYLNIYIVKLYSVNIILYVYDMYHRLFHSCLWSLYVLIAYLFPGWTNPRIWSLPKRFFGCWETQKGMLWQCLGQL